MRWLKSGKQGLERSKRDMRSEKEIFGGLSAQAPSLNELPLITQRLALLICIGSGAVSPAAYCTHSCRSPDEQSPPSA
jgi:hypothetical protein